MTVFEMLAAILKAYPGATADALATHKPAFYARFSKREGPHLEAAFNETLATFVATARQPFPIAAHIEAHMPSLAKLDESAGKPIRDSLQRRGERSRKLISDWMAGQGAKIHDSRAKPLYAACLIEAMSQAIAKALDERVECLLLSQKQLDECFQRALSKERAVRHGRPEKCAPDVWWSQLEEIAREWGLEITPAWWSDEAAKTLNRKEAA